MMRKDLSIINSPANACRMNEHEELLGLIFNRKPNEQCEVCVIQIWKRSRLREERENVIKLSFFFRYLFDA